MKKNVRKALAISGLAFAIGASSFTLRANAGNDTTARIQRSHQERIVRVKNLKSERISHTRGFAVGTVSVISENSITIENKSKHFSARISAETRLLDGAWNNITLSDIKIGDRVKVFGTTSDGVISAKTIRNISNR